MNKNIPSVPAISVLMSCYNAARWLDLAIKSVLNQTFTDFEFIIINDGSLDNTLDIIERFAATDTRIVVVTKPNSGLSDSLNSGIQKARGAWIARLDADDICLPTRLERQIHLTKVNPALVFIGSGLTIIDEYGKPSRSYSYPARHPLLLRNLTTARKFPPHSSAFYRAEVVRSLGGYRCKNKRAEDWDLWLRLSEVGELACIDAPLLEIRKHTEQISHYEGGSRQLIDSRLAIISYWLRRYGFQDPADTDEESYLKFVAWVKVRLEENSFFARQDHLNKLKSNLSTANILFGIVLLVKKCLERPIITLQLFQDRIFGETISRSLALEFIHTTNATEK